MMQFLNRQLQGILTNAFFFVFHDHPTGPRWKDSPPRVPAPHGFVSSGGGRVVNYTTIDAYVLVTLVALEVSVKKSSTGWRSFSSYLLLISEKSTKIDFCHFFYFFSFFGFRASSSDQGHRSGRTIDKSASRLYYIDRYY